MTASKDEVGAVVRNRAHTHGDFSDHARITQYLKAVIRNETDKRNGRLQGALTCTQAEAIDMILHKIGRIIAGDPNEKDHWLDIEGYARITRERITNAS